MKKLIALLSLLFTLIVCGCSGEPVPIDPALVGTWRSSARPDQFLVLNDGGGGFFGSRDHESVIGWKVVDHKLHLNLPDPLSGQKSWQQTTYQISADGKELNLTEPYVADLGRVFKRAEDGAAAQ